MIHVAYRLVLIVSLGVTLCWFAIQERRLQELEMVSANIQDEVDIYGYFLKEDFRNIETLTQAHNSACMVIEKLLVNAGFEVQNDE